MLKVTTIKVINCRDWDDLVEETYGKPYHFQQQYGCQSRGMFDIEVPCDYWEDEEEEMNIDLDNPDDVVIIEREF